MASRADVLREIRYIAFEMMERISRSPSQFETFLIYMNYVEEMRRVLVAFLPRQEHDPFVLTMICRLLDFDYDDFVARE